MRLTEKFKDSYWDEMELNYGQNNTSQIIDKLGQLEDIEEKYNITSLNQLEMMLSVMRSLQGLMAVKQSSPAVVSRRENTDGSVEVGYTSDWSIELSKQLTKQQDEEFKKFLLQYCGYDKLNEILRIIKEKWVDIVWFSKPKTLEEYNKNHLYELTQAEFDLLKEWLK